MPPRWAKWLIPAGLLLVAAFALLRLGGFGAAPTDGTATASSSPPASSPAPTTTRPGAGPTQAAASPSPTPPQGPLTPSASPSLPASAPAQPSSTATNAQPTAAPPASPPPDRTQTSPPAPGNLVQNPYCEGTHNEPPGPPWVVASGVWDVSLKEHNPSPGHTACRLVSPRQGGTGQGVIYQDLGPWAGGPIRFSWRYIARTTEFTRVRLLCDGAEALLLDETSPTEDWTSYTTTVNLPACQALRLEVSGRYSGESLGLKFTDVYLGP